MVPKIIVVVILTAVLASLNIASQGTLAAFFIIAFGIVLAIESIRVVPQQQAWVVERLGRFHGVLEPGLNVIWPFFDHVAYKH